MAALLQTLFSNNFFPMKAFKCFDIQISHKCLSKGPINHMPALVQMACCWTFNKPLSEIMMSYFTGAYCIHASLGLKGLRLVNFYSELVVFRFLQKCVCVSIIIKRTLCPYTVWYHCNAVSSLKNPHKRDPIARPLGRDMGCLLWIEPLIYIPPSQCSGGCNTIWYITAL